MNVSPEGIDALLDVWPLFEAFQTGVVSKRIGSPGVSTAAWIFVNLSAKLHIACQ